MVPDLLPPMGAVFLFLSMSLLVQCFSLDTSVGSFIQLTFTDDLPFAGNIIVVKAEMEPFGN